MSFLYNDIKLCEKYMLESYLKEVREVFEEVGILLVCYLLNLFLELIDVYLRVGVNCKYLYFIKEKEFFIILRISYSKQEIVNLFYEIIGMNMSFKVVVLLYVDCVNNCEELVQVMGMSIIDFVRKFKVEFGELVYLWLLK